MKLTSPADRLWPLVDEMGATRVEPPTLSRGQRKEFIRTGTVEINDLDIVEAGVPISVNGYQVVLYIPDQRDHIDRVISNGSLGKSFTLQIVRL